MNTLTIPLTREQNTSFAKGLSTSEVDAAAASKNVRDRIRKVSQALKLHSPNLDTQDAPETGGARNSSISHNYMDNSSLAELRPYSQGSVYGNDNFQTASFAYPNAVVNSSRAGSGLVSPGPSTATSAAKNIFTSLAARHGLTSLLKDIETTTRNEFSPTTQASPDGAESTNTRSLTPGAQSPRRLEIAQQFEQQQRYDYLKSTLDDFDYRYSTLPQQQRPVLTMDCIYGNSPTPDENGRNKINTPEQQIYRPLIGPLATQLIIQHLLVTGSQIDEGTEDRTVTTSDKQKPNITIVYLPPLAVAEAFIRELRDQGYPPIYWSPLCMSQILLSDNAFSEPRSDPVMSPSDGILSPLTSVSPSGQPKDFTHQDRHDSNNALSVAGDPQQTGSPTQPISKENIAAAINSLSTSLHDTILKHEEAILSLSCYVSLRSHRRELITDPLVIAHSVTASKSNIMPSILSTLLSPQLKAVYHEIIFRLLQHSKERLVMTLLQSGIGVAAVNGSTTEAASARVSRRFEILVNDHSLRSDSRCASLSGSAAGGVTGLPFTHPLDAESIESLHSQAMADMWEDTLIHNGSLAKRNCFYSKATNSNALPKLRAAPINHLIERMTSVVVRPHSPQIPEQKIFQDTDLMNNFLATHRHFMSSYTLLAKLFQRFFLPLSFPLFPGGGRLKNDGVTSSDTHEILVDILPKPSSNSSSRGNVGSHWLDDENRPVTAQRVKSASDGYNGNSHECTGVSFGTPGDSDQMSLFHQVSRQLQLKVLNVILYWLQRHPDHFFESDIFNNPEKPSEHSSRQNGESRGELELLHCIMDFLDAVCYAPNIWNGGDNYSGGGGGAHLSSLIGSGLQSSASTNRCGFLPQLMLMAESIKEAISEVYVLYEDHKEMKCFPATLDLNGVFSPHVSLLQNNILPTFSWYHQLHETNDKRERAVQRESLSFLLRKYSILAVDKSIDGNHTLDFLQCDDLSLATILTSASHRLFRSVTSDDLMMYTNLSGSSFNKDFGTNSGGKNYGSYYSTCSVNIYDQPNYHQSELPADSSTTVVNVTSIHAPHSRSYINQGERLMAWLVVEILTTSMPPASRHVQRQDLPASNEKEGQDMLRAAVITQCIGIATRLLEMNNLHLAYYCCAALRHPLISRLSDTWGHVPVEALQAMRSLSRIFSFTAADGSAVVVGYRPYKEYLFSLISNTDEEGCVLQEPDTPCILYPVLPILGVWVDEIRRLHQGEPTVLCHPSAVRRHHASLFQCGYSAETTDPSDYVNGILHWRKFSALGAIFLVMQKLQSTPIPMEFCCDLQRMRACEKPNEPVDCGHPVQSFPTNPGLSADTLRWINRRLEHATSLFFAFHYFNTGGLSNLNEMSTNNGPLLDLSLAIQCI